MKRCEQCGHSAAAHIDGARCALCGCVPGRTELVQEALPFRSPLVKRNGAAAFQAARKKTAG